MFTKGDLLSIQTVVQTLDFFGMISGLKAKPAKSCIYFGGLSNAEKERILEGSGFVRGEMPFKYLGLPLASS